ncbi:MAG TPA: hypothetical protein DEP36_08585 [Gammaproteobacteria bacterium]|nr:hypothetical protein [Candidatus Competibacteraceae bacterium]MCP5133510.1 hypothetical protein [Gammaproteobacteria bacterium]HCB13603.1 hypothetical protein [Gammaproteobacteria bacterium]HRF45678.1 hypothetical protein [Candidatus Competibacteraceae bacterium]
MKVKTVLSGLIGLTGLLTANTSHTSGLGTLSEQLWSQSFCEQAVSLAQQRGEAPEQVKLADCRLLNYYQPSYWQCVMAVLQADAGLKLNTARERCLAGY